MVICTTCADRNGDLYIDSVTGKGIALPGEIVEITVTVRNTSTWFYHWVNICLIDTVYGLSQTSDRFELSPTCLFGECHNVRQYKFYVAMPNGNVAFTATLIKEEDSLCEATKQKIIYKDTGGATHLECIEKICTEMPGTGNNQCSPISAYCTGGGGGTCDSAKDMNIMGMCVPKQVVFFGFILAAIYMFKS